MKFNRKEYARRFQVSKPSHNEVFEDKDLVRLNLQIKMAQFIADKGVIRVIPLGVSAHNQKPYGYNK